ncbi:RNA polymerase sigma-70 factor (ECF subfamily) [Kribbella sp. VKM Ac-2527]|uniref:RNA polymerase sigma-70 factor (ECF subfamily) n=1 Tax=Kribbella caucasensis TaxID=2512215 RepID=A0A4R6K712_9ACTN|nr:RNA polymerase sigma-70 factor [Kribbella sp. VKM Ac-2527]TDO45370.1 RNA polymerase sigma-70 factor (ECF subfamily) [Kribbella sp. VKM Ac-2527]
MTAGALELFEEHRGRMFGIAYRMLGTVTDADEVLQDAWLRWQGVDHREIAEPSAFLAKTVTNLCLSQLTSARARRETYVGEWLPEPVLTGAPGPLEVVAAGESVSFALLRLLERLTPAERAAYVLREAFGYSHREVAELVGTTEINARQLHSRARKRIAAGEQVRPVDAAHWRKLVERFLAAARLGDIAGLEALLADDVVSRADGGGKVNAARRPVHGREKVARYLVGVLERFGAGILPYYGEANGEPVLVAADADGLRAICFFTFSGDELVRLELVMNPDKLTVAAGQLSRLGGLPSLGW